MDDDNTDSEYAWLWCSTCQRHFHESDACEHFLEWVKTAQEGYYKTVKLHDD